jgi:predicted O-methyltransferase YrrM
MRFFWHSVQQGIQHFFKAKKRHGVHSPLVYQLMDRDLVVPLPEDLHKIESYRRDRMQSKETWTPCDYGAGSRTATSTLGEAVAKASSHEKKGGFLYRWVNRFQPKHILELGTHIGVGTAYLLEGNREAELHSIEGDPFLHQKAAQWLLPYGDRVTLHCGSFDEQLQNIVGNQKWDLVVIDGHHEGEALLRYFTLILPNLSQDAWVIMDDIHWSPDMTAAWQEIISNTNPVLTLDFLHWGVYGHSPRLQREHYDLRY